MFAVIRTGGKQYRIQVGDLVKVEKLEHDLGEEITLNDILLVGSEEQQFIGTPLVKEAKVTAVVTQQNKRPKVIIFKKKRRHGYRLFKGHRQLFTELFIKSIIAPNGKKQEAKTAPHIIDPSKKEAKILAWLEKQTEKDESKSEKNKEESIGKVAKTKKKMNKVSASAKKKKKVAVKKKKTNKKVAVKKKSGKKAKKK